MGVACRQMTCAPQGTGTDAAVTRMTGNQLDHGVPMKEGDDGRLTMSTALRSDGSQLRYERPGGKPRQDYTKYVGSRKARRERHGQE